MSSKKKIFLGFSIVLLLIIGVTFGLNGVFQSPQMRIAKAFKNLEEDAKKTVDHYFEGLKLVDFVKNYSETGKLRTETSLKIEYPAMKLKIITNQNLKKRQAAVNVSAKLPMRVNLNEDLKLINDELYLDLPAVTDKGPFKFNLANFGKDFVNSELSEDEDFYLDSEELEKMEKVKILPFEGPNTLNEITSEFKKYIGDDFKNLIKNMEITGTSKGEVEEFKTTDYEIVLKGEDIDEVLSKNNEFNSYMFYKKFPFLKEIDEFDVDDILPSLFKLQIPSESFIPDVNIKLSIDSNNRLRQIEFSIDDEAFSLSFLGKNSSTDNIQIIDNYGDVSGLDFSFGDVNELTTTSSYGDTFSIIYDKNNKEIYTDSMEDSEYKVVFKDVTPGKKYNIELTVPGEVGKVNFVIDSSTEEIVAPKKSLDVFKATFDQIENIKNDIEMFDDSVGSPLLLLQFFY